MGLSGNERKRPGWFEDLGIRIRTSGGLLNYLLVKFGLGDPTTVSISRLSEDAPTYRCPVLPFADLAGPRQFRDVPGVLVG
jgi:hypothetical protein